MIYAGFDRADCPPLSVMAKLIAETNLRWCGFYLPAPSQPGTTWKGKRAALVAQGWGLAPIFVGQQVTGPGSRKVTAAQGEIDGANAAKAMAAEGFAAGSWCFLDLENGLPLEYAQKGYIAAYIDGIEHGGYQGGVYCSFQMAPQISAFCPDARIWVFHVKTTAAHPVAGEQFPTPNMSESGYPGAVIWQRDDEGRLVAFGDLAVDLDASIYADPGAPDGVVQSQPAPTPAPAPIAVSEPPTDPEARRKWIQHVLNERDNAGLEEDGDIGDESVAAMADYLAKHAA